jgi:putative colanic acid biosynthesis acetyltransferase WcaF
MKRDLTSFSVASGFKLALKTRIALWFIVQHLVFRGPFITTSLRPTLLKIFGSSIGSRVLIRRGVRIHFPWNLEIGDDCWIGEEVWFINHEKVKIGSNVCISQRSIICSGGHDYRSASLEYAHKPIEIKDGAWVCLDAKVLPGVTIGECSVVSAGEIVRRSIPDYSMLIAGEIRPINPPK